jgi:hypothetical protein
MRRCCTPRNDAAIYDFRIETTDKAEVWRQIVDAADAPTDGEPDLVANMANVAALLFEALPELNWAGFYRNVGGEPVLGPCRPTSRPASGEDAAEPSAKARRVDEKKGWGAVKAGRGKVKLD